MSEREWKRIERHNLMRWLVAEARWRSHQIRRDGMSVLGEREVAWELGGLLLQLELHLQDLPEPVRHELLKSCAMITNHDPERRGSVWL